ncbi:MAG: UDP-N-acetylmuramoyl-L-alanyl-D-glutamate--2,6-diaminopimelate ligase [Paludibacteraceae bacterium]|nr:UDP-N-acetylmuramoyl-L-alanyl-D-glutamate--2,6-diaminopimelate ligase [Paludibacteraceae bacterium]
MKKLSDILVGVSAKQTIGNCDIDIADIQFDSRKVAEGALFIAISGTQNDGHAYIASSIEKGAKAIVCEQLPANTEDGVCYIQVENSNDALGYIAANWNNNPSKQLKLVGVTGTNGKTTTATLLYQLFRSFGHKCGLLSTVVNYIEGEAVAATHTTPDPIELNALLAKMVEAGCEYAFMEVSSHSVDQRRIGGLEFDGAIFTNLTRDHLDYHKTFENYLKAKKRFFDDLSPKAFALTNLDDKNGEVMLQNTKAKKCSYSVRQQADFRAKIVDDTLEGLTLTVGPHTVDVPFVGRFNASNLMAVYGAAVMLGKDGYDVLVHISGLRPVNGRFEAMRSPEGFTAIVDYAHTPDALQNVLKTIKEVLRGRGNIITVCGAGGNRDKGKRPLMAQEAVNASNTVIITSDNPRFEDPQEIINDMLAGLDEKQQQDVLTIVDRKQAIKTACKMAKSGDVVLVAGKGHENYQDVQGVKHHFDDHEVIREIFNN